MPGKAQVVKHGPDVEHLGIEFQVLPPRRHAIPDEAFEDQLLLTQVALASIPLRSIGS
jgi:hypothetical protein